ncbi:hypothetical protein [Lacinutrix sp.]|uniref:hypothetical protein n=1 Tax=Lacinutrix sp. TaxID=1937692 RepID=UPI0035C7A869
MSDTPAADCQSSDPNDCRYWCYKAVPAQNITINTTELASDASFVRTPDCDPAHLKMIVVWQHTQREL